MNIKMASCNAEFLQRKRMEVAMFLLDAPGLPSSTVTSGNETLSVLKLQ
jgi:hypothetical protein